MRKIISLLQKACFDYDLIEDGDKIAVGVSGGKDSLTLLKALCAYRIFSKQKFDICAITIDLSNGIMDFSQIQTLCNELNVKYTIIKTNVFEIIFDERKEKNPCSLCAKMRRGTLNETAVKLGCNKVALAHHADDLIETFMLSLLHEGRLSTFMPKTYLTNTKITVIRPLVYVWEDVIKSEEKLLPVVKNICKVDKHTQREKIKNLLTSLDREYYDAKKLIFSALIHDERYNLLDKAKNNENSTKNTDKNSRK